MVGWHHRLNGHEFEQALGVGDGQGGLACCSPWSRKESDTTERPNDDEESGSFTFGCSRFLSIFRVETESCLRSKQVLVREKDPLLSGLLTSLVLWRGMSLPVPTPASTTLETQNTSSLFSVTRVGKAYSHRLSLWRNRLARSAVNRKVGGSSPLRDADVAVLTLEIDLSVSHRKPIALTL